MSAPSRVILVLLLATSAFAHGASAPIVTKEMALKAVILFRDADPFSEDARAYAAIVFNFVEKDPDVLIRIDAKAVPIFGAKKMPDQTSSILLAAFFVGNLDSQLLRGRKKNDSYAGDLQLIETYRRMQKEKPRLHIPEVERLIELESRGQLKSYLASR